MKPRLYKCGAGWYCEGDGLRIFASTPQRAYDCWEFARLGYKNMLRVLR